MERITGNIIECWRILTWISYGEIPSCDISTSQNAFHFKIVAFYHPGKEAMVLLCNMVFAVGNTLIFAIIIVDLIVYNKQNKTVHWDS